MPMLKQQKPQGTVKELPPTALSNRQWLKSAGVAPRPWGASMKKLLCSWLWLVLLPTSNLWAAPDAWLEPAITTVATNTAFNLQLFANSNGEVLGGYDFTINFPPTQMVVDIGCQDSSGNCDQGICPGVNALGSSFLDSNSFTTDNDNGTISISGFDSVGQGPSDRLHLFTINFKSFSNAGDAVINLIVTDFTDLLGNVFGSNSSTGSTISIIETSDAFLLTVTKAGSGTGYVKSSDSNIDCGNVCSAFLNSAVTLTATPDSGSKFIGWSNDCSGGAVTMDANKNCIVTFNLAVTAPSVTTNAASNITTTSAILNGSVTSNGAITTASFDFGTTAAYGTNVAATPAQVYSSNAVAVSATKSGLICGTIYHYRVRAFNSAGTGNSADKTFVTTTCTYTVTPTAGTGGTVSPSTAQTVTGGAKINFTATPNTGYTRDNAVSGTCPQGTWSGNMWTTGAIVANCTVSFSFTPIIVNGVCGSDNGGTFNTAPTANLCSSGTASAVNGTGPWTWNCFGSNGGTTANCTANAVAVNAWLAPPKKIVLPEQTFTLAVTAKSNNVGGVGFFVFMVTFDANRLRLDTGFQGTGCSNGVCPGANALTTLNTSVNDSNLALPIITLTGSGAGTGPGNDLQLLIVHFQSKTTIGDTTVSLITSSLATPSGNTIGLQARGATVTVTTGLCGDATGDLVVNIVDALAIARKLVGLPPPPTIDVNFADVDRNGIASIGDALQIARYSVGLLIPPEMCKIGQPL